MTSPPFSSPHSTALRRLKAAHDASRAAEALKRGDKGRAAELYLSSAAASATAAKAGSPTSSSSSSSSGGDSSQRARTLSNASAALCVAGRFKEALEAADEAIKLSSSAAAEEEEDEEQENEASSSSSLSLTLCPSPPKQKPKWKRLLLGWSKPHWRRGAALRGLEEHLAAALAFADAHGALEAEARKEVEKSGKQRNEAKREECAVAVRQEVLKGGRCARDAAALLCDSVLARAEEEGRLLPRSPLSAAGGDGGRKSLRAAAAAVVAAAGREEQLSPRVAADPNSPTSPCYLSSLSRWLVLPPSLPQLLVERSNVFAAAGQWRAAAQDARNALELSLKEEEEEEEKKKSLISIASPYRVDSNEKKEKKTFFQKSLQPAPCDAAALAMARALVARPGEEHRDCREAAKVLAEGISRIRRRISFDLGSSVVSSAQEESARALSPRPPPRERAAAALAAPLVELLKRIQESEELLPGEVGEILSLSEEQEEEKSRVGGGEELGARRRLRRRRLRLDLEFSGYGSSSPSLDAGSRSALLLRVSKICSVARTAAALERVSRGGGGGDGSLSLSVSVAGVEAGDSSSLESRLRSSLAEVDLFPTSVRASFVEDEDETKEEGEEEEEEEAKKPPSSSALVPSPSSSSSSSSLALALVLPPPPPPPPRLTDSKGRPFPPLPRHAFALSRIHYSAKDQSNRSADSWLDAPGVGVRWRQSAGEVSVIVSSVAVAGLSAAQVEVGISPRRLTVKEKKKKKEERATQAAENENENENE